MCLRHCTEDFVLSLIVLYSQWHIENEPHKYPFFLYVYSGPTSSGGPLPLGIPLRSGHGPLASGLPGRTHLSTLEGISCCTYFFVRLRIRPYLIFSIRWNKQQDVIGGYRWNSGTISHLLGILKSSKTPVSLFNSDGQPRVCHRLTRVGALSDTWQAAR